LNTYISHCDANGGVDQYFGFDNGRLRPIIEAKVLVERFGLRSEANYL